MFSDAAHTWTVHLRAQPTRPGEGRNRPLVASGFGAAAKHAAEEAGHDSPVSGFLDRVRRFESFRGTRSHAR